MRAATNPADEVARLARGLVDLKLAYEHQVVGCTEAEVAEVLKSARNFPLPAEYPEFLRRMGREAGRLLIGTDLHYPEVLDIPADAIAFAAEDAPQLDPAGKHFFAAHQGYQFYFFTREHPGTVFLYTEGDDEPVVSADTFLGWLWNHAESEATISSRFIYGNRFPS
ncbi:SMI1/KNR4 family protein [Actinosynnema sp. NPDC050436]|uniref:SMI1/KNR4 family protein n=1 Tax=Actinosynnema sp. NPDC050436 TaxID=3155659 RepID=UPI0033D96AA6